MKRILGLILAASTVLPAVLAAGWNDQLFDGRPSSGDPPEVGSFSTPTGSPADQRLWVVVKADRGRQRSLAAALGLSIEEASSGAIAGIVSPEALSRLKTAGYKILSTTRLRESGPMGFPGQDSAYHDYAEVEAELGKIATGHPDLASLVEVGNSHRGLKILALRFNSSARGLEPSAKPGALFLGAHHAREHLSSEVPLLIARWLAQNRSAPEVSGLLETRDIYIIPLVNPDGSEFDIENGEYRWHRKNMRPNEDGSLGTDLNRNYDSHWGESGTSTNPGDDTYGGPKPFSEPESRAVKAFIEARPNLKVMVSYHTYSELILYPWSYTEQPLGDARALKAYVNMAQQMASWTGYTAKQSGDFYPSSGDTCDWAWEARKIFCFTFELTPKSWSGGGFYPGPSAIEPTVQKNIRPVLYLSGLADDPRRAESDILTSLQKHAQAQEDAGSDHGRGSDQKPIRTGR